MAPVCGDWAQKKPDRMAEPQIVQVFGLLVQPICLRLLAVAACTQRLPVGFHPKRTALRDWLDVVDDRCQLHAHRADRMPTEERLACPPPLGGVVAWILHPCPGQLLDLLNAFAPWVRRLLAWYRWHACSCSCTCPLGISRCRSASTASG